jgi:RNA polymerase sigma-70 factor (ECF subfamily)
VDLKAQAEQQQLVNQMRSGDGDAFRVFQERYLGRVFSYLCRRTPRREDAEDIAVEVFASAYSAIASYRGDSDLLVWLVGIARRKLADFARRAGRRPALALSEAYPTAALLAASEATGTPDSELAQVEERETLRRALATLPETHREALLLRYVEGLTSRDIGELLRRSEDGVNSLLYRAKAALRERLTTETADPGWCRSTPRAGAKGASPALRPSSCAEKEIRQ